ncbi:unnamed protein product [Caenorhabditis nigoni]
MFPLKTRNNSNDCTRIFNSIFNEEVKKWMDTSGFSLTVLFVYALLFGFGCSVTWEFTSLITKFFIINDGLLMIWTFLFTGLMFLISSDYFTHFQSESIFLVIYTIAVYMLLIMITEIYLTLISLWAIIKPQTRNELKFVRNTVCSTISWTLLKYGGFFTWLFLNTVDMETVVWVALILQSFNLILPFVAVIRQFFKLLSKRNENTDSGDYPGLLIPIQIYGMNSAKPVCQMFRN